jgi:hypothetical protein
LTSLAVTKAPVSIEQVEQVFDDILVSLSPPETISRERREEISDRK